jgi:hypothetical protein
MTETVEKTKAETLLELAERCEKAAGPDRELDVLIKSEIDGYNVRWDGNLLLAKSRRPPHDEYRLGSIDPGVKARNFRVAWSMPDFPRYTGSLDAALTLVPEGWSVLSAWNGSAAICTVHLKPLGAPDGIWPKPGKACTLALAHCAAALRAHVLISEAQP